MKKTLRAQQVKYKPLPYQALFHASKKPMVYLSAGYGCLPADQLVDTVKGPVPIQDVKATVVQSFEGGPRFEFVSDAYFVGQKPVYRVVHDHGEFFAAGSHLVCDARYNYVPAQACLGLQLFYSPSCSCNPLQTILEFCQLVLPGCDPHYSKIIEDWMDRCSKDCHRYDQLLHQALNNAQELAPLLNGATKSDQYFYPSAFDNVDALTELKLEHIRLYQCFDRLCNNHSYDQLGRPEVTEKGQTQALAIGYISKLNQSWQRFLSKRSCHHRACVFSQDFPSSYHGTCQANTITTVRAVEYIGAQECFDLYVPRTNAYLSAGLVHHNSGKTHSLCMHMFKLMSENRGLPGGLLCPDLKMFKRDVVPTIVHICRENQIRYKYHKTEYFFFFPMTQSTIYVFHSQDDGQSIRGPNLAFMLINEVTLCSKPAFDAAISRVRLKQAKPQIAMSGTPESFNWAYEYFIEEPRKDTDLIFGDVRQNKHISPEYVDRLLATYDDKMVQQYVEGKFVNLVGNRAAWSFDRFKHVADSSAVQREPHSPIWVSMDFNVDPMTAVLWNRMPLSSKTYLQAFDEITLKHSNTYEFCDALKAKLNLLEEDITIYPDPAGKARSSKSPNLTDIDILKNAGFNQIKYKPRIMSVRDCLNATNNLLDKGRVLISKKCSKLIADLEQCTLKDNGEIDKSNPMRSHYLDGMKNMIDYEFPVSRQSGFRTYRIR